jgi:hypothetical protein
MNTAIGNETQQRQDELKSDAKPGKQPRQEKKGERH